MYVAKVTGTNGELVIKVGRGTYTPSGYTSADRVAYSGAYTIWTKVSIKDLDTVRPEVTLTPDSGIYIGGTDVTLSAKNASKDAQIIYTTDKTTPSLTNGTKVNSGTTIRISKKTTLKAVVCENNKVVSTVKTATYTTEYLPVTIYLLKPKTWSTVNFYAWSDTFEANTTARQLARHGYFNSR